MTVPAHDHLTYTARIAVQLYHGFVYLRILILSFFMRYVDTLSRAGSFQGINELFTSAAQSDKLDAEAIKLREVCIAGEFGIEDQHGNLPHAEFFSRKIETPEPGHQPHFAVCRLPYTE